MEIINNTNSEVSGGMVEARLEEGPGGEEAWERLGEGPGGE